MKVHLTSSRVLPFSPEQVWHQIRDFNGLPSWHPMIAKSAIEGGKSGDQVGAVRNFFTHDGGNIREQLLALDDHQHAIVYSILESGMGVSDYIARIQLHRVTSDNSTFAVWSAEFDCAEEKAQELRQFIGESVFQEGLAHLESVLKAGQ
jgi:hypothetical protein